MSDAELKVEDYQLVPPPIASGSSTQVWEVRDAGGQSYAMKLLLPAAFKEPEQVGVLKREAKVAQALEHPNIVRTIKFVKSKTHCYMLMELFRVPSLKSMLQNEPGAAQARFARLADQLCTALGFMHEKGWLHHDIKPDNILFSKGSELKLIDFSLAMRRQGGLGKVFSGKVKAVQGTRTYIAPETIQKQYPTPQSDIYSFGVTLFEVLTGQPPFVASNPNDLLKKHLTVKPPEPSALNPNLTPEADKFILRMLAKKPAHRPKDMSEVATELRSLMVFKRDPMELEAEDEAKRKGGDLGLDAKSRLDSRADAARTAAGVAAPARQAARKPTAAALAEAKAHADRKGQRTPGAGQPAAPGYAAPAWPGYDQQAAYWGAYPQALPAAPQPYYPYPPAAAPYPTAPAAYGAPYPAPAMPQPVAPQPPMPAPQPPAQPAVAATPTPAPAPAARQPAAPTAPRPQQSPQYVAPGQGRNLADRHVTQEEVTGDLPLMEELPEVL